MWFEQKFVMDEQTVKQIKIAVILPWAGQVTGLVMLAVGTIFLTVSCIIACLQSRKTEKRQQMEINLAGNEKKMRQKKEVSPLLNQKTHPRIMQHRRTPLN
jgi:hypothetical protein